MPNKWLVVNGLKYPAEDGMTGDTVDEPKKPSSEEPNHSHGLVKNTKEVREISLEEALEFQRWVKENKDL